MVHFVRGDSFFFLIEIIWGKNRGKDRNRGWKSVLCTPLKCVKENVPLKLSFTGCSVGRLPSLLDVHPQSGYNLCPGVPLWTPKITRIWLTPFCENQQEDEVWPSLCSWVSFPSFWRPQPLLPALTSIIICYYCCLAALRGWNRGPFSVWVTTGFTVFHHISVQELLKKSLQVK